MRSLPCLAAALRVLAALVIVLSTAPPAVLASVAAVPPADQRQRQVTDGATLLVLADPVEVSLAGGLFAPALGGETIGIGDVVQTGMDGAALLAFFDGSELLLTGETQVLVEASAQDTGISLLQVVGTTVSRVQQLSANGGYQTMTPTATAVVRGTTYLVTVRRFADVQSALLPRFVADEPHLLLREVVDIDPVTGDLFQVRTWRDSATGDEFETLEVFGPYSLEEQVVYVEGVNLWRRRSWQDPADGQRWNTFENLGLEAQEGGQPLNVCTATDPQCVSSTVLLEDPDGTLGRVEVVPDSPVVPTAVDLTGSCDVGGASLGGSAQATLEAAACGTLQAAANTLPDLASVRQIEAQAREIARETAQALGISVAPAAPGAPRQVAPPPPPPPPSPPLSSPGGTVGPALALSAGPADLRASTSEAPRTGGFTPISGPGPDGLLTDVVMFAGGYDHVLAVRADGTLWAWGVNYQGQLGLGTTGGPDLCFVSTPCHRLPVQVPGLTDVVAVGAGRSYSVALRADGTVWAWGVNEFGQLGNGQVVRAGEGRFVATPTQVQGLSGVTAIATGERHTLALRGDGSVWGFGSNVYDELGVATPGCGSYGALCSTLPIQVAGLAEVTGIAAGSGQSLAVRSDGVVLAWGLNYEGTAGREPDSGHCRTSSSPCVQSPTPVEGLGPAVAVSAGERFSVALLQDGTVWAWGRDNAGQLGNGQSDGNTGTHVPQRASDLDQVRAVLAAGSTTLAIRADGTAWGWGNNRGGQLAHRVGSLAQSAVPLQLPGIGDVQVLGGTRDLSLFVAGLVQE